MTMPDVRFCDDLYFASQHVDIRNNMVLVAWIDKLSFAQSLAGINYTPDVKLRLGIILIIY